MEQAALFALLEKNFPAPFGVCDISAAQPYLPCRAQSRIPAGARSVLVFLFPYYCGPQTRRNISRYAAIPDYHQVAGAYLARLQQLLGEACPDAAFEPFVDNSPLREVRCGQAAGLGVVGANGLLIHPRYGSYCFLGELVTDLPLTPSQPLGESCPCCGRCLAACPTGALQADGSVDQSRCRSAISQKKGTLSPWEKEQLRAGGLVWGCDICGDVCPLNQNLPLSPIPEFRQSVTPWMEEEQLLSLLDSRPYNYRGKKTILRNFDLLREDKKSL